MSKLTKKFATVSIAVATVVSLTGLGIAPVGAATLAELQAQLADLTAQIAAMGGDADADCYAWTGSLTLGSTGAAVTALQTYLTGTGHFTYSGAMGYFGSITQGAVAAWQAANGVSPAAGYWGPISQAMYATMCGDAADDEDADEDEDEESADLEGGAGSAEYILVSGLSGEEVGEGGGDVDVAGLEVEALGSDLELVAVRLVFVQGTANNDFEDYADEVSVSFAGEELARVDADEFNDDNTFSRTLTLDGGGIVREGDKENLVVSVSGASNIDTNDVGETWTVDFRSVRYQDAQESIISEDPGTATRTFSFESFSTSADLELKIALQSGTAADAINKAHLIDVDAVNETDNVRLLAFTLEAEGDSDLKFNEFGVDLVVTGAGDVDDMVAGGTTPAVRLIIDGDEYGTATYNEVAANNREILFDDIDYTLPAGDKVDAFIEVDLADSLTDDLDEGDTILAQITAVQTADVALVDVRDESNTQVAVADISGTAVGEAHRVYNVIFTIATDGWTNEPVRKGGAATLDDEVTFDLEFIVTAVDGDVYIDNACTEDADGTMVEVDNAPLGFNFFQSTGTLASIALTCSFTTDGATAGANGNWLVSEGESETFNIAVNAIADVGSSFVQVTWEGLGWSEADEAGDRLFEGSLDDTYKSSSESLTMN